MTRVAECAKEVRKFLKEQYKECSFSVTSENYSMGDNVNVYLKSGEMTDDQANDLRNELRARFTLGTFDGMDDSYNFHKDRDDTPKTYYIFFNR